MRRNSVKKLGVIVSSLLLSLTITGSVITPAPDAKALSLEEPPTEITNPTLKGPALRERSGSTYWETSNLREWLNSDTSYVDYTNLAPTPEALGSNAYSGERGFLYDFNTLERDGVAVTKRRTSLIAEDSKASHIGNKAEPYSSIPHEIMNYSFNGIERDWKNYYSRITNDKVFNLSPIEIFNYVQKRGWGIKKSPTSELKKKANINVEYTPYFLSALYSSIGNENVTNVNIDGKEFRSNPQTVSGTAPAIHLKPEYEFSDGKKASNLKIGEIVEFGKYDSAKISWIVINKAGNGSPLLWSEKVITRKVYDTPGDTSYENSEIINFPDEDVDISENHQIYSEHNEIKSPIIKLDNESDLMERKNDSWIMNVSANDESGIKKIILPDGSEVNGSNASFTANVNKVYIFTAMDINNNYSYLSIPVGNINPPANVIINSSANGWTNKDVTVDIFASNDVKPWIAPEVIQKGRDYSGPIFPDYSSYAGKKFRVTGNATLVKKDVDIGNFTVAMAWTMNTLRSVFDTNGWHYSSSWPNTADNGGISSVPLRSIDGATQAFDFEFTVPSNYFNNINPRLFISVGSELNDKIHVKWTDVKYELLDDNDFQIEKIVLPSGQEILGNTYKDKLTAEGSYTYKVHDNRGKVTEKSITVMIDKTSPALTLTPSVTETTHSDLTINAIGSDALSGVKRIRTPNSEWVSVDKINYNVTNNGTYSFIVEDNAGNQTTRNIIVSNIDKSISMTKPIMGNNFGEIELTKEIQELSLDVNPIGVTDWTEGANHWRVEVSADPLTSTNGDKLPGGNLYISPLQKIEKIGSGSGGSPTKQIVSESAIDTGSPTSLVTSNSSRGEHLLSFPSGALKFKADPTKVKPGSYSTTINWELVRAP
jgi:hypothetical protein